MVASSSLVLAVNERNGKKRKREERGEGRVESLKDWVCAGTFVVGQFFGATLDGLVRIGTRLLLLLVTPIDGSGWGLRSILHNRIKYTEAILAIGQWPSSVERWQ